MWGGAFKSKKNRNLERKERLSESNDLSLDRDTLMLCLSFSSPSPRLFLPPSLSLVT